MAVVLALTINSVSTTVVNSSDDIITINASASGLSDKQYLQAVFTKEGESSNYFGLTQNNSDEWYKYKSSPTTTDLSTYFYSFTPTSGTWSGELKAKIDVGDTGYKGPGNYILKLFKSTSSSVSRNTFTIAINIPLVTATPTPVYDPEIKLTIPSSAKLSEEIKCNYELKNLLANTEFYLKIRGGTNQDQLTKVQTKNNGGYLSDNESWTGFPLIKTDNNGSWSGEIFMFIPEDRETGEYKIKLKVRKKETETSYESELKEIQISKVVNIVTPTPSPSISITPTKIATKSAVITATPISIIPEVLSAKTENKADSEKNNGDTIAILGLGLVLTSLIVGIFTYKNDIISLLSKTGQ